MASDIPDEALIDFALCEPVDEGDVSFETQSGTPAPQCKPAGKAKAKSGNIGGAKKNKKMCNGCALMRPVEQFSAQAVFCNIGCEATTKRLRRVAKQQGKMDWFKSVLRDPVRLQRLIKYYAENCPKTDAGWYTNLDIFNITSTRKP